MAGERFAVRNSGVHAVVEAVGDHGCEYMTGGRVVILGPTGRNFAAGMSGGVAYILDEAGTFPVRCNKAMVGLGPVTDPAELAEVRAMVERHVRYTGSARGRDVLARWDALAPKFVKVLPKDYARVLEALKKAEAAGLSGDDATNAAFEANARDVARMGGG
jgi:glutamate synthase (ferredoxin)